MLVIDRLSKSFPLPRHARAKSGSAGTDPRARGGVFRALAEVSFSAPRGRILGVLGRNGAGKTTLLRVLSTALRPSSGTARYEDTDITQDPAVFRRRLGFLSGTTGVYGRLTPRELLRYHGRLHGVSKGELAERVAALADELGLQTFMDRRCDTLSTGMKQKVSIARTLIHNPDVVVLDEPTSGLDIVAAQTMLQLVHRCRERGKTVLLSTHQMPEVESLCERVVVLEAGRLCFEGTPDELRHQGRSDDLAGALLAVLTAAETGHVA